MGVSRSQDPHLAFAYSKTIDCAVDCEFRKAMVDRFNQSHTPKGVSLISPRDKWARFQGDGSRPAGPVESNLLQTFLPTSLHRKESYAPTKAMKTQEETARRFLNGLNQLDALKNTAAATMLLRTDPSSDNRVWK